VREETALQINERFVIMKDKNIICSRDLQHFGIRGFALVSKRRPMFDQIINHSKPLKTFIWDIFNTVLSSTSFIPSGLFLTGYDLMLNIKCSLLHDRIIYLNDYLLFCKFILFY
jgi:hypothetical protein